MAATAPFEIVVAPFQIYTAPINEVRPDLADAPAGNWLLLGTNGSKNYSEDGVSLTHEQETAGTGVGSGMPVCVRRGRPDA